MGKAKEGGGCAWRGAKLRGCWISSLGEKNKKEKRGNKEIKERKKERKGKKKEKKDEGNRTSVMQWSDQDRLRTKLRYER